MQQPPTTAGSCVYDVDPRRIDAMLRARPGVCQRYGPDRIICQADGPQSACGGLAPQEPAPEMVEADAWRPGLVAEPLPPQSELMPLPGAGTGGPVVTSNNPEIFTGDGLLYGQARRSGARGGGAYPLSGPFGVYLHHLNRSGAQKVVSVLITNPSGAPVWVEARGSGYAQTETGGLGLGRSPDYRVSAEWIHDLPQTVVTPTATLPNKALVIWQKTVPNGAEVDGRFRVNASGPVSVRVVAAPTADVTQALSLSQTDAPGEIAVSGTPPPPFGREAGVYAFDTWRGEISAAVPAAGTTGRRVGFMVNTATGGALTPVQAFPALTHYADSAAEAVGMYGNVYDLSITLRHDGRDGARRQVRVIFASLATANISRYWDGVGLVDEQAVIVRHTPTGRTTTLATITLAPGETKRLRFRAMVPGLASIPQALYLESRGS